MANKLIKILVESKMVSEQKVLEKNSVQDTRALVLLSSGIDSPVATWQMKQKGFDLIGIHFSNEPFTDKSPEEKTIKLAKHLGLRKLYVIKHGFVVQPELMRRCENKMRCVLCRRMMFRISEQIAKKEDCEFLVTGENLAQVASQTLQNMTVAESATNLVILRPLLCYDKIEIINIAKEIGTYETSIEASMCCNAVPKNPITKSKIEQLEREEQKLDLSNMLELAIKDAKIIELK